MRQQLIEVDHHGAAIRGTVYLPDAPGRRPTVLFLHGFTGQRMESGFMFVKLGRALAERGIAAVTFDFINSGESDGSFEQMLVTGELADTLRMTEWLQGQPFVDRSRLGLLGFSLGGLLAACASGRVAAYKALVLVAPTTVENITTNVMKKSSARPIVLGPHIMHTGFFDDIERLNPLVDVVKHPRATLLVQGTADTAVPPAVAQQYVTAMKNAGLPIDVQMVDGADHGFGTPPHRAKLNVTVLDWLTRAL